MEDNQLAAAAARSDQHAFGVLVERYRAYVYTIAYKVTLNAEDALDVTQNVFVRLVERIGSFSGQSEFRSWLAAIAANEAVSFRRSPRRREVATDSQSLAALAERKSSGGGEAARDQRETFEMHERRQLVEAAMAELSPQQRAICALRLMQDMAPKEIAGRLGLPESQVRSQFHRALGRLRELLAMGGRGGEQPRGIQGRKR